MQRAVRHRWPASWRRRAAADDLSRPLHPLHGAPRGDHPSSPGRCSDRRRCSGPRTPGPQPVAFGGHGHGDQPVLAEGRGNPLHHGASLYHRPDLRTIGTVVWMRTAAFVRKAGTVILAVSVAVWLFSYLPIRPGGNEPARRLRASPGASGPAAGTRLEDGDGPAHWYHVAKENAVATLGSCMPSEIRDWSRCPIISPPRQRPFSSC